MEISGSTVAAGFALLGVGMVVGGICLATHGVHISAAIGGDIMFKAGGLLFVGACITSVILKIAEKEESAEKIQVLENEDLAYNKTVFDSIKNL